MVFSMLVDTPRIRKRSAQWERMLWTSGAQCGRFMRLQSAIPMSDDPPLRLFFTYMDITK
jgi:hypothetical protein